MVPDEEIKEKIYKANPYKKWIEDQVVPLEEITEEETPNPEPPKDLISRMKAFGYTVETMQFMLLPIVKELRDPLGSMGNDAALACLSDKPRLIFDYFKQLFAQVTNPAIDSIREEVIMSLECLIGPEGNLLSCNPENAHRLRLKNPIISDSELSEIIGFLSLKLSSTLDWPSFYKV
jgi:Glutamate synthase central domain.